MVYYLVSKDKRFRSLNSKVEQTKIRFSFLLRTSHIPYSSKKYINFLMLQKLKHFLPLTVRSNNRCLLTGRSGSVFRYFRLSRICLKNLASNGLLVGVRKSS